MNVSTVKVNQMSAVAMTSNHGNKHGQTQKQSVMS